jgi:hypothetical protein
MPFTQPGLVLLLDEPVAGGPAARFSEALRRLLGLAPNVAVHDLADLRRQGITSEERGPLATLARRRWLVAQAAGLLRRAEHQPTASQLVVVIAGFLDGVAARRYTARLLDDVGEALRGMAIPSAVAPAIVAVNVLPERWSPYQAAALHAWRREMEYVTDRYGHVAPTTTRFAGAFVLGRNRAPTRHAMGRLALTDSEIATSAAQFTAACLQFRVVDWLRSARRGMPHRPALATFGIAPLPTGSGDFDLAVDASDVLWPGTTSPQELGLPEAACAVVASDDPDHEGWEHVLPLVPHCLEGRGWLLQVRHGMSADDLAGASEWRARYRALPPEQRRRLHGLASIAEVPETAPAPTGFAPDPAPPFTFSL